nr:hypothetical protein [uncultured bacterium]
MDATRSTPYDEVYDFLLSAPSPEAVIAFHPSEQTQARVRYLLDANRNGVLSATEQAELDEFSSVEHFVRMLKIRAQKKLSA